MAIKELFNDARPQVLFDPRASQRIDPRFKFTRDGVASYYDKQGNLKFANQNQVRFNHNPDTKEPLGMLLEKPKTNIIKHSNTLNASPWSNQFGSNVSITTDSTLSPAGTTASKVTEGNTNALQRWFHSENPAGTIGWAASIYAKAGERTKFALNVGFGGVSVEGTFDLAAGTASYTGNGAYVSTSSVSITPIGSEGWYHCTVVTTTNVVGNMLLFILDATGARTYLGNGSSGFYAYGAQLETGNVVSSYIQTGASHVTREPDLLTIEAPLPATGSIYIDARSLGSDVDDTLLSAAPASPSTDKLALAIRQPASLYNSKALVYEVDGAFKPTLPFPVPSNAQERNLITYGANNYHYRSDSARLTPSSSSSVPANMTRLGIGHDVTDETKAFIGYINAVYLWPGEITPTVAEALVRGDVDPKDADAGVFTPAAGSLAFVFNTQGTATDGNAVVQLPLRGSTNNVLVDWGDNTSSSLIGSAASVTVNHTYSSAGIYPVQIEADDDGTNSGLENLQFYNNSPADLVRVLQWGGSNTFQPTTMYRAFRDCTQMDFENGARNNLPDTSAVANWQEAFYNCSSLSGSFPSFDFSGATTFSNAWYGCSSMTAFPAVDDQTDGVINFSGAWSNCSNLTNFPLINTAAGTSFSSAWYNCSSLTSFPLINTAAGTSFYAAWSGCSSLDNIANAGGSTSFPLINTALGTNFYGAWYNCSSLTVFPLINTAAGINFSLAWYGCSSLTNFPLINTAAGTSFSGAWQGCSSLTNFPLINTAAGTSFSSAWQGCSSLTSFPLINTAAGTSFYAAWSGCSSLDNIVNAGESTSFPLINTAAGTSFYGAWYNCSSLTIFPANFFDSWSPTSVNNQCFYLTWDGCTSLTPASVVNILDSIAVSGQSAPSGTGTHDKKITIDFDSGGTGDPATDAAAAITTLKSRNWQIYLNDVLQ